MRPISHCATAILIACFAALTSVYAEPISGQGTWETTLQARDLNGDGTVDAWYDTTLDITWLENTNLPLTNDMGGVVGIGPVGDMNWNTAVAYVGKMVSSEYLGQTGWRLPRHTDIGSNGCPDGLLFSGGDCGWNPDTSTGEMAHMFVVTLGNTTITDPATGLSRCGSFLCYPGNTGPFINVRPGEPLWYGQENVTDVSQAWEFAVGRQLPVPKRRANLVWPVIDGDAGTPAVEPLVVTTADLPVGFTGIFYTATLAADGGELPYQWQLSAGALPAGLNLNEDTGEISGVPTETITIQVQFTVIDAVQKTSDVNLTIIVSSPNGC